MTKQGLQSAVDEQVTQFGDGEVPDAPAPETSSGSGERVYLAGEIVADRYRLERKLGEGGMGVVWVAHSLVLDIDVALKLIRASVAGGGVASRMAREAHAAAKVAHPALVRVFDFGWTSQGDPFLVMELAQGETLDSVLAREVRIPAIRAVQILLPLADGLRCAHEKGVIHRDLKPENVFLAADPFGRVQPKLLDFGIAKIAHHPKAGRLTRAGAVLGSPEFMSPEQARGELDVDERTDVWSMCVMLYEMITGVLPFQKDNYNALMQSILLDDPVPTHELGGGDEALWQVISRGLEKSLDERWGSMTELGESLALWLYEHGITEDVSGNSVRALWLDGTVSGLQWAPVTTSPPEPAEPALEYGAGRPKSRLTRLRRRVETVRDHARKGVLAHPYAFLATVGVAGALGVALTMAASSREPQSGESLDRSASAQIQGASRETRKLASPEVVGPDSAQTAVRVETRDPSDSKRLADTVAPSETASSTAATNAKPPGRAPKRAARRPSTPRTRVRDFGF